MIEARYSHPRGISYFETIGSISVANHNCFFLTSVSDEVSITGEGRGESRVMKRGGGYRDGSKREISILYVQNLEFSPSEVGCLTKYSPFKIQQILHGNWSR